jgi:glycosyltransferase involved in cell wall biosynthesis
MDAEALHVQEVSRPARRIVLVSQAIVRGDGQGRVNYEVAVEALRRGHAVDLVACRVEPDLEAHPGVRWARIAAGGVPTQLVRNLVFSRRSAAWLAQHRAGGVVLANGCVTRARSDVNAAHFVHGAWLRSPHQVGRRRRDAYGLYQWVYTYLNARWERGAFAEARWVVAVSEQVRGELVGIGVAPERIRVIPNGVDVWEFSPGPQERGGVGLPEGVPLGLFVGDIRTPRKNLDTVLLALSETPALHLAVVGDLAGSPYPRMAAELGLAERVTFLGRRPDVPRLMRAADLVVFPSRYDPFGLVITEAMSSGRPIVTASTAGAACLVEEGCGVVLDDPEDVPGLARALTRLVCDPALRERMGERGRGVAEGNTWGRMASAYVDLLEGVADGVEPHQSPRAFLEQVQ